MKKASAKTRSRHDLVSRDLHSLDASDLLRPFVLAAISELPEHRRVLYLAQLAEKLARLDEGAKAA
jgi:hypothetical protein